jgi:hypothetical protein
MNAVIPLPGVRLNIILSTFLWSTGATTSFIDEMKQMIIL